MTGTDMGVSATQWEDDGHWSDEEGATSSDDGSDEDMESDGDAGWDLVERVEGKSER